VRAVFGGRLLAGLAVSAVAVAGCGGASATPTPGPTSVAIGATPWPAGTVGQYGLRIDPSLIKRLPIAVGGVALTEDAGAEAVAMDDKVLSAELDRYAAAMAGDILAPNFVRIEIVQFKPESQTPDVYSQWIDDYATSACANAGAVGDVSQDQINGWLVDVSTCTEGVIVYSLSLGDGQYLSMFSNGPKDLGKLLLSNLS
jgi:hypothetical protein